MIDRRDFLRLLGATALTAAHVRPGFAASSPNHVVVVGAGIIGSTVAYYLAKRGAQVTVLDRKGPGLGTTSQSFAYLNASTKTEDRTYHLFNALGVAGWHRLQIELNGALPVRLGGAVHWRSEADEARELLDTLRRCQEWGSAARQIDEATLCALLPNVVPGPVTSAVLYEHEGSLDPLATSEALIAQAKKLGATVRFPVEVTGFDVAGDRVRAVKTSEGEIKADAVVIAAGIGSGALGDALGVHVPYRTSPMTLIHLEPQPPLLERIAFAPGVTLKQEVDGRVVISGRRLDMDASTPLSERSRQILQHAAQFFPQLRDAKILRVIEGLRVYPGSPGDGFPIIGYAGNYKNVYLTFSHSGVTLAPVIAQLATQELLEGVEIDVLSPYRLSRYT
jgi:Glycine/D-amino acid oxidases (deaminating)